MMNVEKALSLINNKKTTIDDVCKFVFKDIAAFQDERESFYIQEFKNNHDGDSGSVRSDAYTTRIAEKISDNTERDTKVFVREYVTTSIDTLLDEYNNGKVKIKNGIKNFMVLLTQVKDSYK